MQKGKVSLTPSASDARRSVLGPCMPNRPCGGRLQPYLTFLLLALAPLLTIGAQEGPFPGQMAPNFTLPSLEGKNIELKNLYAKGPVWLTLFTTWCPECRVETPALVKTSQKRPGITFIAVSLMEDNKDVEKFRKKYNIAYPVLIDEEGETVEKYSIRPIPVNIGIHQGGLIAFRRQSVQPEEIEGLMLTLQGAPSVPEDQPINETKLLASITKKLPLLASFLAGILTFLSPCILPLIPVYLSLIAGIGLEQLTKTNPAKARQNLLLSTTLFILGFGLIFIAMGATATTLGQQLGSYQKTIRIIGGILLIPLGLHLAGLLKIPFLYRQYRIEYQGKSLGPISAFLMGIIFAAGWTPCVGPILAGILLLSSQQETVGRGVLLLSVYSAGLGIPFLLASVFLGSFKNFLNKIKPYFNTIEKAGGGLLILLAILLLTNKLAYIAGLLPTF